MFRIFVQLSILFFLTGNVFAGECVQLNVKNTRGFDNTLSWHCGSAHDFPNDFCFLWTNAIKKDPQGKECHQKIFGFLIGENATDCAAVVDMLGASAKYMKEVDGVRSFYICNAFRNRLSLKSVDADGDWHFDSEPFVEFETFQECLKEASRLNGSR